LFSTNITRLCRLVQEQRTGNLCRKNNSNPVKVRSTATLIYRIFGVISPTDGDEIVIDKKS